MERLSTLSWGTISKKLSFKIAESFHWMDYLKVEEGRAPGINVTFVISHTEHRTEPTYCMTAAFSK